MVFGRGGFTTFEALAWIDRVGATFIHLDRSSRVVATSGQPGPDFPALRRAQVAALETDSGLSIVKRLLSAKLSGQRRVVQRFAAGVIPSDLADAEARLDSCTDSRQALVIEAKAASAYWKVLASIPVRFANADTGRIPDHWSSLGERHSILSSKPRLAVSPAHAILNFLYHLATAEASLGLLALGLDPGLGWAHRDAPYRDSAALDLVEAVRPDVDEYVLDLLAQRTFSRREFVELPIGQVRLAPSLAKLLAESTLGHWEAAVGAHAQEVARTLSYAAALVCERRRRPAGEPEEKAEARSDVTRHRKLHDRSASRTRVACVASFYRSTSAATRGGSAATACRPSGRSGPTSSFEPQRAISRRCGHRKITRSRPRRRRPSGSDLKRRERDKRKSGTVPILARTTDKRSSTKSARARSRHDPRDGESDRPDVRLLLPDQEGGEGSAPDVLVSTSLSHSNT